jgi:hypothetical protein
MNEMRREGGAPSKDGGAHRVPGPTQRVRSHRVFVSCTPGVFNAYTVHGSDNDVVGFRLTVEQELVEVLSGGLCPPCGPWC